MSKRLSIKIVFAAIAIILVGCESTGVIQGISEGRNVQFEYQQGFLENDGTLRVTMLDGETYVGKFVQTSSSTSGNEWEIGELSTDDSFIFKDSKTVSSRAEAILIGNNGNTMQCKFQFSKPNNGIDGGGIGSCKTSTDKSVNLTF